MNNIPKINNAPTLNKSNKAFLNLDIKWKWTLIITLLMIGIFNPFMYSLTNFIFLNNNHIYDTDEMRPTTLGVLLHVMVYMLVLRYLLDYD